MMRKKNIKYEVLERYVYVCVIHTHKCDACVLNHANESNGSFSSIFDREQFKSPASCSL